MKTKKQICALVTLSALASSAFAIQVPEGNGIRESKDFKRYQSRESAQFTKKDGAVFVATDTVDLDYRTLKVSNSNHQRKYIVMNRKTNKFGSKEDYCIGVLLSELEQDKIIRKNRALRIAETTRLNFEDKIHMDATGRRPEVAIARHGEIMNLIASDSSNLSFHEYSTVFTMDPSSGFEYIFCSSNGERGQNEMGIKEEDHLKGIEVRDLNEIMAGYFEHLSDRAIDLYQVSHRSLSGEAGERKRWDSEVQIGRKFHRKLYVKNVTNNWGDNCSDEINSALNAEKKRYQDKLNERRRVEEIFNCTWEKEDDLSNQGNPDNWFGPEKYVTRNSNGTCDGERVLVCENSREDALFIDIDSIEVQDEQEKVNTVDRNINKKRNTSKQIKLRKSPWDEISR